MQVTFKRNPAPIFTAIDNNLKPISSDLFTGEKVYVSITSIDITVCDTEVHRFNQGAVEIENVQALSDYKNHDFRAKFVTYIKELELLARAVFVVDENSTVTYVEYCKEVSQEPDYEFGLNALK